MSKQFLYAENQDGGMDVHYVRSCNELKDLYGWMSADCAAQDKMLRLFMATAEVGGHYEHRLGVCVRLQDV